MPNGVNICTTPRREEAGTVLIMMKGGQVVEVISDLQLDVQVCEVDGPGDEGSYAGFPSRPLWEFVRKTTARLLA